MFLLLPKLCWASWVLPTFQEIRRVNAIPDNVVEEAMNDQVHITNWQEASAEEDTHDDDAESESNNKNSNQADVPLASVCHMPCRFIECIKSVTESLRCSLSSLSSSTILCMLASQSTATK